VKLDESSFAWSTRPSEAGVVVVGALLAAPLSFLVSESIRYAIVPLACAHGRGYAALHLGTLLALSVAALGALGAGRRLKREADPPESGHRFLAWLAVLSCALFGLSIIAQWLPAMIVGPCQH
jgi:hypothetical protein